LWYTPESVFTHTIPLPEGGGVCEAVEAGVDFADLAGAAAGAGAFELAAGGGVDAAGVEGAAEPYDELAFELDAAAGVSALVFLLRVFLVEEVDASAVAGAFDESVAVAFVLASAEVFFDRDFFDPVDVSAVAVVAADVSLDADLEDLDDCLVPVVSDPDPDEAEVSAAADLDDFFDLLEVVLPLDAEESVADESDDAAFFLDLLLDVPELLLVELSVALASELAVVFLDFFLLVVLLLLLASDCC
jgi:hypothetical protein